MPKYERRKRRLIYIRDMDCIGLNDELAYRLGVDQQYIDQLLHPDGTQKKNKQQFCQAHREIIRTTARLAGRIARA